MQLAAQPALSPPTRRPLEGAARRGNATHFIGVVLGCMDSYDSNQILILQHFSRSTRLAKWIPDFCKFSMPLHRCFKNLRHGMRKSRVVRFEKVKEKIYKGICCKCLHTHLRSALEVQAGTVL